MKNIIPFKKDLIFKTNISEVTSISLENTLVVKDNTVSGDFIISGEYKVSDKSTSVESFEMNIPFEIVIDERYDSTNATVDIDDFYYEIINDNVMSISIDVLLDKLKEKPVIELEDIIEEDKNFETLDFEDRICDIDKEEDMEEPKEKLEEIEESKEDIGEDKIKSLFNQFNTDSEVYVTYNVFIVREGDNVDSILERYGVALDELKEYNDLTDLKIGDKLIIPCKYERN